MDNCTTPLKRCTKCGAEKPATTEYFKRHYDGLHPRCKECKRADDRAYYARTTEDRLEYQRQYRAEHKEKISDRDRRYRVNNPEKIIARRRQYARENREKIREAKRLWGQNNPDKVRERSRRRRSENPEFFRLYDRKYYIRNRDAILERTKRFAQNNPLKVAQFRQGKRARKRAAIADFTPVQWLTCLEYFNHTCAYCGAQQDFWHVLEQEHFVPLAAGGGYTVSNIIPACKSCNSSKQDKPCSEWLRTVFSEAKVKTILARIEAYFSLL